MNIHNFANRQLCEYASIFPTVASLLDHLLFTIGNGYDLDEESGMIVEGGSVRIDQYPKLTPKQWAKLIAECHEKERGFAERFDRTGDGIVDEEYLAQNCARYKIVNVSDEDFTEDAIYADLRSMVATRTEERGYWGDEVMLRPYPLSEKYSDIYNLNANTPAWFVQIALNLCNAWIRFLNEELDAGRVWIKPSLREKTEEQIKLDGISKNLLDELFGKGDDQTHKEPESDYADLTWTTRHRDMLVERVQSLESLLNV